MFHKADVHIHTNFSDGLHEPEAIVNYAVTRTDLRVIAVTDHNTIDGARTAYKYWQAHRAEFSRIELIKGVEVSSRQGHILGLFLEEDIPAHMSAADTVTAIHEQGGLAIAAHPFTHLLKFQDLIGIGREIGELPLDGVEVRNSVPIEFYSNWITAAYNRRHRNHPAIGGSDTHYLTMMGQTNTLFKGSTAEDFRQCLERGQVQPGGRVNGPMLALQVIQHLIRRRQLPVFLPDDSRYRHTRIGLSVEVDELRGSNGAVLYCGGQLVRANADLLSDATDRLIDGGIPNLILELSGLTFVDSAGLGAIIAAQRRAERLLLANLSQPARLTIRLVRLDKVIDIYDNVDAAVAALHTSRKDQAHP